MYLFASFLALVFCVGFVQSKYEYETAYLQVPLDHFAFASNHTFQLKYLINDSYWMKDGPIFFYTGNEGYIETFAQNTGFLWEAAVKFRALVLFAEHRYYGASLPFGKDSFKDPQYFGHLTSEQALADFVDVIDYVKYERLKLKRKKDAISVIAFGGSYGGMLAAWMRMKYPAVIQGALASSAPIWQFPNMSQCQGYNKVLTAAFNSSSPTCVENIRKSWNVLARAQNSDEYKQWISEKWRLCKPLQTSNDVQVLMDWLSDTYSALAMVNYPYPTDFLLQLPAYPVKVFCSSLNASLDEENLLNALFESVSITFNYSGEAKCLDLSASPFASLGAYGWNIQTCNEMVMPICANGVTDMFPPRDWNFTSYSENCFQTYGIRPRKHMAEKEYGGRDISTASNIIFSNGLLDPWYSGGVTENVSPSVMTIILPNAAHHLDLRASNVNDPDSVIKARKLYAIAFRRWIREYRKQFRTSSSEYDKYLLTL